MVKEFTYIFTCLDAFSFGLVIPILETQMIRVGGDRFILGILASVQSLIQFLAGPLFGSWSDNVGVKRAFLVSCYGLLISQLIFSQENYYCYIISRLINSCFAHGAMLVPALLIEAKEKDPGEVQAKLRALGALSFTLAPIIGGFIMGQPNGFFKLSTLCSILAFGNVVVCNLLPSYEKGAHHIHKNSEKSSIIANLQQIDWAIFGALFSVRFLVETAASIYNRNIGYIFAEIFKCSHMQLGFIISSYGVCSIIVNMQMYRLQKYMPNGYKCGTIGLLGSFIFIYLMPFFWSYIIFIALFSIFKTILDATWSRSIIEMTTEKNNGAVNGAFQSLVQLAGFIAPVMNGYMGKMYGHSSTILLCLAFSITSVITSYKLKIKMQ